MNHEVRGTEVTDLADIDLVYGKCDFRIEGPVSDHSSVQSPGLLEMTDERPRFPLEEKSSGPLAYLAPCNLS